MDKKSKVEHVKSATQTRDHICHWPGCDIQVPPAMWGCRGHWFTLPLKLRSKIWRHYRIGQEITLTPSLTYLEVAKEVHEWAEKYIALRESGHTNKEAQKILADEEAK